MKQEKPRIYWQHFPENNEYYLWFGDKKIAFIASTPKKHFVYPPDASETVGFRKKISDAKHLAEETFMPR